MTRKDYNLIAEVLKSAFEDGSLCLDEPADCFILANQFADMLHTNNPRFLYKRFYNACGVSEEDLNNLK